MDLYQHVFHKWYARKVDVFSMFSRNNYDFGLVVSTPGQLHLASLGDRPPSITRFKRMSLAPPCAGQYMDLQCILCIVHV